MWPTSSTPYLLGLGLIPVLYVLTLATRVGFKEAVSLRMAGVAFLWIGYHLSPWIAYLSGQPWTYFLLVPEYIDEGLRFSLLCMFCFLVGYSFVLGYGKPPKALRRFTYLRFPEIEVRWLLWLACICMVLFVISVGGLDQVWISSNSRSSGQFEVRDFTGKIVRMVKVASLAMNVVLACASALFIMQNKHKPWLQALGWLCLLVASMRMFWWFSRAAGFAFIILAFLALRLGGHRRLVLATFSITVALFLGSVGFNERAMYGSGLATFLQAATTSSIQGDPDKAAIFVTADSNPLDAMAAWTRKTQTMYSDDPSGLDMAPLFFWNLNPLPSELVPLARIGEDLAVIMGTVGAAYGLTTPALAEVYYVFGYAGCLLIAVFGAICAWFEKQTIIRPGAISSICLLLTFSALPLGLHSTMRHMTRPVLYAYVLWWVASYVNRRRRAHRSRVSVDQFRPDIT